VDFVFCCLPPSHAFSLFLRSGDSDTDPRHGGDSGVVPANPREAAGLEHHGSGLQQHRSHAGRVFPRLQDWVLSFFSPALLTPSPPTLSSPLLIIRRQNKSKLCSFQSFSYSHGTSLKAFAAALDTVGPVSWNHSQNSGHMLCNSRVRTQSVLYFYVFLLKCLP